LTDNEKKQALALLTTTRFAYDPAITDSPTYRFIQCCDLLGCSYLLSKQPAPERWGKLPRIRLVAATPPHAWTWGDKHHFMSWHSDLDALMLRLSGEQFDYFIRYFPTLPNPTWRGYKEDMAIAADKLFLESCFALLPAKVST